MQCTILIGCIEPQIFYNSHNYSLRIGVSNIALAYNIHQRSICTKLSLSNCLQWDWSARCLKGNPGPPTRYNGIAAFWKAHYRHPILMPTNSSACLGLVLLERFWRRTTECLRDAADQGTARNTCSMAERWLTNLAGPDTAPDKSRPHSQINTCIRSADLLA